MRLSKLVFASLLAAIFISTYLIPNVFAQEYVHNDVVLIKITEEAKKDLDVSAGLLEAGRIGISSLDSKLASISAVTLSPIIPSNARFSERHRQYGFDRWFRVDTNGGADPYSMVDLLTQDSAIEIAEPSYIAEIHVLPESKSIWDDFETTNAGGILDPLFLEQWHYDNQGFSGGTIGADIDLVKAWEVETGSPDVIVHVMDTGINLEHPDLENMLWVNPSPGSSGYPNDIHGWNFIANSGLLFDVSGHGTHVAGTILAENNNDVGVAGIAGGSGSGDGARVLVARIFVEPLTNPGAGGPDATAAAIIYGADNGAVISNNSWGYTNPNVFPTVVRNAIDYFIENAGYDENGNATGPMAGGVFISSAGNTPNGASYFPAAYDRVISVASTNHNDQKAWYSNFGSHVDISAPGGETFAGNVVGGVYSTHLYDGTTANSYRYLQGTSMASPHVAGVAALIASKFPGITNDEVIARLLSSADDLSESEPGFAHNLGAGRLNAFRALTEDPTPAPPSLLDPENDEEDVDLTYTFTWSESALASSYNIQVSISDEFDSASIVLDETNIQNASYTVTTLNPTTTYYWRVRGQNDMGFGPWSAAGQFTTTTATSIDDDQGFLPLSVELFQNYPNPFNPTTQITFSLTQPQDVQLAVYNTVGQRVATIVNGRFNIGTHTISFDASDLSSGVYLYRLSTNEIALTRKMTLIK